jgi:beta-lactam-binding protein with PASTA domain
MEQRDDLSVVPPLVGLPTVEAHDRALDARLLAVDHDPSHDARAAGTVAAQHPAPGSRLPEGEHVTIWVHDVPDGDEGGGGGGGRPLPVEPKPVAPAGAK